jgi:diguanylate cyclase (GGDEF)-like protein
VAVLVRGGTRTLSATPPELRTLRLRAGDKTMVAAGYRFTTERFQGFGDSIVLVGIGVRLGGSSSWLSGAAASLVFVGSFIVLAAAFVLLASRTLGRQLELFLQVARRLGKGELLARVPVEGHDEFAALARELNRMSDQLASRIDELGSERVKLRESIRRIGQTFAANLDRQALLELALRTAIDAVGASCGRLSARSGASQLLAEVARVGSFGGFHEQILTAEREALESGGLAESDRGGRRAAAVALGPFEPEGRAHALITVGREGEPFTEDDREVLRSLASEATLALENVELHFQVQRQASTDELTRLANHRQFQELLTRELDEARRYRHPVALIMVDIDDFKTINDTYGHPQGDVVLRDVGRILRQNSREVDVAARYGGEEMALILPHTDLEGAYAIAERVRGAVEGLRTPRLDERGELQITISAGVAATVDATKDTLIAEADAALYAAKRQGKNQTVKAGSQTQEVLRAE